MIRIFNPGIGIMQSYENIRGNRISNFGFNGQLVFRKEAGHIRRDTNDWV